MRERWVGDGRAGGGDAANAWRSPSALLALGAGLAQADVGETARSRVCRSGAMALRPSAVATHRVVATQRVPCGTGGRTWRKG